jgi:hypothetical protein
MVGCWGAHLRRFAIIDLDVTHERRRCDPNEGSVSLSPECDGLARGKTVDTLAIVFWGGDGQIRGAVAQYESLREPCRIGPAEPPLAPEKNPEDNSIHRCNFDCRNPRV